MKERTMLMMHKGYEMNEKMKFNPKTKQSATKHKVNIICYDEETGYRPMHDKGSKDVCNTQMKHNNIRMNACPTHKHDAMRTTKHRYLI